MKDPNIKIGSMMWTCKLDSHHKSWDIFSCVIIEPIDGVFMHGYHEVKKLDGIKIEVENSMLFKTRGEAEAQLLKIAAVTRDNYKTLLFEYTKSISDAWNRINFCTELIDQLRKDAAT